MYAEFQGSQPRANTGTIDPFTCVDTTRRSAIAAGPQFLAPGFVFAPFAAVIDTALVFFYTEQLGLVVGMQLLWYEGCVSCSGLF